MIQQSIYHKAALRHAQYYLDILKTVKQHIEREPLPMRLLFNENFSQIIQAREWLLEHHPPLLIEFVLNGITALAAWNTLEEQIIWLTDGIHAAETLNNVPELVHMMNELSECYLVHQSVSESYEMAQKAWAIVDDPVLKADTLVRIGRSHIILHRHDPHLAQDALSEAVTLYEAAGAHEKQSWALHNLASAMEISGDLAGARDILHQAIELLDPLSMTRQRASSLSRMGAVLEQLGEIEAARQHIEAALHIAQYSHNNILMVSVLMRMSDLHHAIQNYDLSNMYMDEALEIARRVGANTYIASITYNKGVNHLIHGNFAAAVDYFLEASGLYRSMNHLHWLANANIALSLCAIVQNQYDVVTPYLAEANQLSLDALRRRGVVMMYIYFKLLQEGDEALFVSGYKHLRDTYVVQYYTVEWGLLTEAFNSRELEAVDATLTYDDILEMMQKTL